MKKKQGTKTGKNGLPQTLKLDHKNETIFRFLY